jgi:hypothetical protein
VQQIKNNIVYIKKTVMNYKEIVNKICVALNIEVKLEQMKLNDGVTVIEADSFEANNEVFIITEDEQKIPMPVGEYVVENGMLLIVTQEGVIAEIKEQEAPAEEEAPEEEMKKDDKMKDDKMIDKATVKKTVESMVKETFFSEMESLKEENERLKTELAQMQEPKPIVHNPESKQMEPSKAPKSTMDLVLKFINK